MWSHARSQAAISGGRKVALRKLTGTCPACMQWSLAIDRSWYQMIKQCSSLWKFRLFQHFFARVIKHDRVTAGHPPVDTVVAILEDVRPSLPRAGTKLATAQTHRAVEREKGGKTMTSESRVETRNSCLPGSYFSEVEMRRRSLLKQFWQEAFFFFQACPWSIS